MVANATKLTIGYPVYDDFDGLYFSAMDLPLTHPEVCDQIEVIVVDNHPESPAGKTTQEWVENHLAANLRARYVAFPGPGGPALTKQKCVDEAGSEFVLVMDSHVRVARGGLAKLLDYYAVHPDAHNLYSGPMLYDSDAIVAGKGAKLTACATHMDEVWRGENLGIWATDPRGITADGEPFEVPAMGCGLFTVRKDAFVGFNKDFRGFGGEEYYLHHKTRKGGHKCICLPFLRWVHRFGRPHGVSYPLLLWDKVRNYVIGHQELGLPLAGIFEHFVASGKMPPEHWAYLLEDPVKNMQWKGAPPCNTCGKPALALPEDLTLDALYQQMAQTPSDINEHAAKLRELASQCAVVVDLGHRSNVSTTAMLAAQPERLFSYDSAPDPIWPELEKRNGKTVCTFAAADVLAVELPECDLLFEDSKHTAEHVYSSLTKHAQKVRRYLVFHDTQIFGERGEDGGPGILPALRRFMQENPQWSVVYHSPANNGLTVLSRNPADKPPLPSLPKMAWNYAKAIAKHTATGAKKASEATVAARMEKCSLCPNRTTEQNGEKILNRCSVCGCYLDEGPNGREGKLEWAESFCPISVWGPEETHEEKAA